MGDSGINGWYLSWRECVPCKCSDRVAWKWCWWVHAMWLLWLMWCVHVLYARWLWWLITRSPRTWGSNLFISLSNLFYINFGNNIYIYIYINKINFYYYIFFWPNLFIDILKMFTYSRMSTSQINSFYFKFLIF